MAARRVALSQKQRCDPAGPERTARSATTQPFPKVYRDVVHFEQGGHVGKTLGNLVSVGPLPLSPMSVSRFWALNAVNPAEAWEPPDALTLGPVVTRFFFLTSRCATGKVTFPT